MPKQICLPNVVLYGFLRIRWNVFKSPKYADPKRFERADFHQVHEAFYITAPHFKWNRWLFNVFGIEIVKTVNISWQFVCARPLLCFSQTNRLYWWLSHEFVTFLWMNAHIVNGGLSHSDTSDPDSFGKLWQSKTDVVITEPAKKTP